MGDRSAVGRRGVVRRGVAALSLLMIAAAGLGGDIGWGDVTRFETTGHLLFRDAGAAPRAATLWGQVACQRRSRIRVKDGGSDPNREGTGRRQRGDRYRRLKVVDGDDIYGERCELGENDHRDGPTALYHEGQRRITFLSLRLPRRYPLGSPRWQTVMQMKQSQPSANGGGGPVIELQARHRRWKLIHNWNPIWSAPARKRVWTRFAFDVVYSRSATIGSIKLYVDLNRDGDAVDRHERSPRFHTYTLKTETAGGSAGDGIAPGHSIPSHLRVGIYHHPAISCPRPRGCGLHVDNVQVLTP